MNFVQNSRDDIDVGRAKLLVNRQSQHMVFQKGRFGELVPGEGRVVASPPRDCVHAVAPQCAAQFVSLQCEQRQNQRTCPIRQVVE